MEKIAVFGIKNFKISENIGRNGAIIAFCFFYM